MCSTCYETAVADIGPCPACGSVRVLPGRDPSGQAICPDCARIDRDFRCTRCHLEGLIFSAQVCVRCTLAQILNGLLDDGHGQTAAALAGLRDELVSMKRPMSGLIWLRRPQVSALLTGLADGTIPLSHETFDRHPHDRVATHIRSLLVAAGALPQRNEILERYQRWLTAHLAAIDNPQQARTLRAFSAWQQLPALRRDAQAGTLQPGATAHCRQELNVINDFYRWLDARPTTLTSCHQADIDAWLATGASTRRKITRFIAWTARTKRTRPLDVVDIRSNPRPTLADTERIDLLRALLDSDHPAPAAYRLAGVLLLLYGLPFTRMRLLTLDHVLIDDHGDTYLNLGDTPAAVPTRVAALFHAHLANRPNLNTAYPTSPWIFPGLRPGQPRSATSLMNSTRTLGIHLRAGRNAAIRQFVLNAPPPVIANVLGYSPQTIDNHAAAAGRTYTTYAAHRSK